MSRINLLIAFFLTTIFGLFLFSFTQVDLSLTLSQNSIFQTIEQQFQQIGFFQRPLSTIIFSTIAIVLFSFYLYLLRLAKKGQLQISKTKVLVSGIFLLLVFSYNAFSYDLFNYIFDAKIFTFYHLNPYLFKPTDFPGDPMLNFMRWTHRVFPYGPSWLFLTIPLSYIGSNIFIITFFLFKLLMGFSYLGCSLLIYKISEIIFPKEKIFNTIFWSLNPLVIIEGLISSHNDFPMIFFFLLSFYLYLKRKKLNSAISYLFSVGVKFSTGMFLPLYLFIFYLERTKKNIDWEKIVLYGYALSIATVFIAASRTTFQPWYLILPITLGAFISKKYFVFVPVVIASISSVVVYGTYVLLTDYAPAYPGIILNIELIGIIAGILLTGFYFFKPKSFRI